ncbi:MAG: TIGR02391 family protein [Clostridia bacterium]
MNYYHIWIELKELDKYKNNKKEFEFDVKEEKRDSIVEDIFMPYLKEEVFNFKGKMISRKDISKLYVTKTEFTAKQLLDKAYQQAKESNFIVSYDYEDVCFTLDSQDVTGELIKETQSLIGQSKISATNERVDEIIGHLHKKIYDVSYKKYQDGHYADAVETAIKEINDRLKKLYQKHKNEEKDGRDLFNHVFNDDPIKTLLKIADLSTQAGKNEQEGYRFLFMGAWVGIRDPKAHANELLSKDEAYDILIFASMLMKKIDMAIAYTFAE